MNIISSALNIARVLQLEKKDKGMNIMPLFHIHGLIAGILSTFYANGSMICTNGFDALTFFKFIHDLKPTWYSGVPTMHQLILSRAKRNRVIIDDSNNNGKKITLLL